MLPIEEDTGALQKRQVARHRRGVHTDPLGQLADTLGALAGYYIDDVYAGRVTECLQNRRPGLGLKPIGFVYHFLRILPIKRAIVNVIV